MDASPSSAAVAANHCRIRIAGSEQHFDIGSNEVLLPAALALGIDYPHNCRVGTCGSCKTRLVSGRISPMVDFALSPLSNQELRDGYILACQAKVRSDLEIDVRLGAHAALPERRIATRVVQWRRLPGDVVDLRLALEQPLQYHAGQYCTLAVSGSFVRRSYSFYDAPPDVAGEGAREVGFLVKRLPGGAFSEWLFSEDRSNARIWLHGPYGRMGIEPGARDSLGVAGGTGLAPILSIAAERLRSLPDARFTLVYGVRRAEELLASQALLDLVARYSGRLCLVPIVSHEPEGSHYAGARGLITEALNDQLGVDYANVVSYICGGRPMVEAVERCLQELGVDAHRMHADKFAPTGI